MKKSYFIGADVSKEKIDFCFLTSVENVKPKFASLPNDTTTIKAYFQSFIKDDIFIVFEHTNNYHVPLQSALSDLQIKHSALNPAKISHFLKHLTFQKSDITDAYGLALYCRIFKADLNPSVYNREYSLIKSYNSTILLLSKIQTQLKNFKKSQDFVTDTELSEIIKSLTGQVQKTQEKLKLIAFEILKSFVPNCEEIIKNNKGFGIDLALNLFPQLHFNRAKSEKQFISFLGLSPRIYESGSSVHKSPKINKRGSSAIRRILFLNAFSCVRFNEKFKKRYDHLISKGKSKKVALVAVMCAIVRYLKSLFPLSESYLNENLYNAHTS
ncbi:IS110 family transposase [Campylobacter showae]|uniref:Aliphatic sulfonate ABC transporter permease n=1 Tax=Campylobacter showae CC57C TaxID=1073353 RepID=M3JCN9_9BACT|nr:IS110 family transposase [Campylobacter showae]EMG31063.1 aliphatic sulfonate ABC transporter permease [Campylobacter showae CC57C]